VLSVTGFGQDGRYSKRAGFGKIAEGLSGIVAWTGSPQDAPLFVGFSLADTSSGLFGALAVNAALLDRTLHGTRNCHLDLALYEPLLRMLECQFALREQMSISQPTRQGSNDPYGWGCGTAADPQFLVVRCADGHWVQMVAETGVLAPLRDTLGARLEGSAGRPCWSVKEHASDAVIREVSQAGGRAALVHDGLSIQDDPYFRSRGDVLDATDKTLGAFRVPGYFPKSRPATAEAENINFAAVGADNDEVFTDHLGLSAQEIAGLREQGVI